MFSTKSFTTIQFRLEHNTRNPYLAHMVQVAIAYNSHLPHTQVSHRPKNGLGGTHIQAADVEVKFKLPEVGTIEIC